MCIRDRSDFKRLVAEAHARGLRVITDLPLNHTSDQHPWFQASREDPEGPYGDFYVWSDTDEKYQDARIIFVEMCIRDSGYNDTGASSVCLFLGTP